MLSASCDRPPIFVRVRVAAENPTFIGYGFFNDDYAFIPEVITDDARCSIPFEDIRVWRTVPPSEESAFSNAEGLEAQNMLNINFS